MKTKIYTYLDRYVFSVRETLNGFAVWITDNTNGNATQATPGACALFDEMAFPEGYSATHHLKCQAARALDELAVLNGMTELE